MNPRIKALEDRRDAAIAAMEAADTLVIERAEARSEEEQAAYDAHQAEFDAVEAELPKLIEREQQIARSRELSASLGAARNANRGEPSTGAAAAVADDEPIYRAEGRANFFLDIFRAKSGERDAAERLEAYRSQTVDIERTTATSNLGGLIIPRYAVEKYQELAVRRRVFLNTLMGTPSYGPMVSPSVKLPIETTAPAVGAQSAENTAFATSNYATTELTINANTVGGYSDVSIQSIHLGQLRQERIFQEMANRYASEQERQALWGAGSGGECEGVFLADGTQTVDGGYSATAFAEIYGLVQEAASKVEMNDEREAMYVLMSPGRWRSLLSATDSDGRPLAGVNGTFPQNVGAYQDMAGQKWFGGMRAVVSSHVVKSGEDDTKMAVYHTDFAYFEETSPYELTADQVVAHTGTVRYVTWGYMIFSPEVRVNSLCLINNLGVPDFPLLAVS